ncbi:MAG: hypothetical protein LBL45_11020 [Treponema sp.]|jgi:hypothetical protein|nr:hypothetical protein [Treponema sp.]
MEEERAVERSEEAVAETTAEIVSSIAECDPCCDEKSVAEHNEEATGENRAEVTPSIAERDACRDEKSIAERNEETIVEVAPSIAEDDACRDEKSVAERNEETTGENVTEIALSTIEDDACRDEKNEKKRVMEREDELLQKIIETHNAVKKAVINREWTDFEALAFSLEAYKEAFDVLEKERIVLFALDAGGAAPHFYTMVSHLPEDERRELSDLYRSIKDRALKLQTANEALLRYLNEARSTIGDFMRAAFPDRKNGVYSRQGKKVLLDMRSLILDQML